MYYYLTKKDSMSKNIKEQNENTQEEGFDLNAPTHHIVFTNKELCRYLKVCPKTTQKWRDKGYVSFSKVEGTILYRFPDVLEMLDKFKVKAYK